MPLLHIVVTRCVSKGRDYSCGGMSKKWRLLTDTKTDTEPSCDSSITMHDILRRFQPTSLPQFTITIVHVVRSMARCGGE